MATKQQVKEFINTVAPLAILICNKKSRKVLPSVCVAQACLETGYGTTTKMIKANALYGIKVGTNKVKFGTAWKGRAYSTKTKECYYGSTMVEIVDVFRAYDSVQDSVEDYYDMLGSCSRYAKCIGETDAKKCITAIKTAGYATDPDYVSKIISIIKSNNLTQYDECMLGSKYGSGTAVESDTSNYKHKVGEKIRVSSYYSNSSAPITSAIIRNKTGTILKISRNRRNPYCFGDPNTKVATGWCNDGDIRETIIDEEVVVYTVKSGDTLNKIAKEYNTTPSAIVKKNKSTYPNMNANYIMVGWKLKIE